MTEVVGPAAGILVKPGDIGALASAISTALTLPRAGVREHAVRHCSLTRMIEAYTGIYGELTAGAVA